MGQYHALSQLIQAILAIFGLKQNVIAILLEAITDNTLVDEVIIYNDDIQVSG